METSKAWNEYKRPIFKRMPNQQFGTYQDQIAVSWMLAYWDKIFIDCKTKLDDLPRQFDPEVCDREYLDFLAPLCGWTAPYWDVTYPDSSKRLLLKHSFDLIWPKKGTLEVLSFVLNALEIEHKIIVPGTFILGESRLGIDTLGSSAWIFDIELPVKYARNSKEFTLTKKLAKLFSPAWCQYNIAYDAFYIGISAVGDRI